MKHIVVNLKRFDIPKSLNGLSDSEYSKEYIYSILNPLVEPLKKYENYLFDFYIQEAHILNAVEIVKDSTNIRIGCQSNFYDDVSKGGNFGAFTSHRTASSMKAMECSNSLIGHFEERKHLNYLYSLANIDGQEIVNRILNKEIKMAHAQNMEVCYCIGESDTQLENWDEVLLGQLRIGLQDIDCSKVIIGYEPLWSIGPGKTPADRSYIEKVINLVHSFNPNLKVIYGGGVKQDNAAMLAGIDTMSGGLIGLTNFTTNLGFHADEFLEIVEMYDKNVV
ncbi:MAG: triose-phosphate isomerase family protein [Erysipelotrichaceae bacterium]